MRWTLMTLLALWTWGCDVDPVEDADGGLGDGGLFEDGGGLPGEDGDLPDGALPDGGGEPVYAWAVVVDLTESERGVGTPGADICVIEAVCEQTPVGGLAATLEAGTGDLCSEPDPPMCATARDDAAAALEGEETCEPTSDPSHYVSLGLGGILAVDFGQDLRGCALRVDELAGADVEGYEVWVCADPDLADCVAGEPLAQLPEGGEATVQVPAE